MTNSFGCFKGFRKVDILIIVTLSTGTFNIGFISGIVVPIFPTLVSKYFNDSLIENVSDFNFNQTNINQAKFNYGKLSILFGVKNICQVFLGLLMGYLCKIYPPLRIILAGGIMQVVTMLCYGLSDRYFILILGRVTEAASNNAVICGTWSFIPLHYTNRRQLGLVFGIVELFIFIGMAIGPAYGGWVFQYYGQKLVFLLVIILIGIQLILIVVVKYKTFGNKCCLIGLTDNKINEKDLIIELKEMEGEDKNLIDELKDKECEDEDIKEPKHKDRNILSKSKYSNFEDIISNDELKDMECDDKNVLDDIRKTKQEDINIFNESKDKVYEDGNLNNVLKDTKCEDFNFSKVEDIKCDDESLLKESKESKEKINDKSNSIRKYAIVGFFTDPHYVIGVLGYFMIYISIYLYFSSLPQFMKIKYGSTESQQGIIWSLNLLGYFVGFFIGNILNSRYKTFRHIMLMVVLYLEALGVICISFMPTWWSIAFPLCFIVTHQLIFDIIVGPLLTSIVRVNHQSNFGIASGIFMTVISLTSASGSFLGPILLKAIGLRYLSIIAFSVMILYGPLLLIQKKFLKKNQ